VPERDLIITAVDRTERRLKAARFASDLAASAQVVLAAALVVELTAMVVPAARGAGLWVVAAGLAGVALVRGVQIGRQRDPDRAAAALDRAADLRDELRTAHWFTSRGVSSDWLDLLVRRAAARAASLDVARLVPVRAPRRQVAIAAILAAMVVGATLAPLDRVGAWLRATPSAALTPEEQARLDELQRLLQQLSESEDAARRAQIDALLAKLRDADLTPEERLAIVAELRRLVGELDDEAEWRAALGRAAVELATDATTRPVGDALEAEALAEAAARMRELARTLPPEAAEGAGRALEQASREAGDAAGGFGEGLARAADALRAGDADAARAQLEAAARALDEMAGRRNHHELGRQADQQLAELERAFGERFRSPGDAARAVQLAERQALESDDLSPGGATPVPGDARGQTVPGSGNEQAGAAQGRGDLPGPPTPSASNATGAVQPLGDAVSRRQELVAAGKATGEAPGRDLVDEDTRASRVTVEYEPVEPRASYEGADRLTGDVVPWPYRALVKTYFQVVGPRGSSRDD